MVSWNRPSVRLLRSRMNSKALIVFRSPFAHDNEIVGLHEARFIFDSISSVLRFIRSIEASRFGG